MGGASLGEGEFEGDRSAPLTPCDCNRMMAQGSLGQLKRGHLLVKQMEGQLPHERIDKGLLACREVN